MKLPKVETLIILIFFGCVALWAMSKCAAERTDMVRRVREIADNDEEERPVRRDTIVVQQQPVQQQAPAPQPVNTRGPAEVPPVQTPVATAPAPSPQPGARPARPALSDEKPATSSQASPTVKYSTLYVTIDGLKVRKEPGLKSETVAKLKLYEPVAFLNKKTEWTQEISLGYEKVTDHWVKVRTESGKEGWVFGAGVHYYKMKRKGVMD